MEKEITVEYTRSPFVHGITDAMDMNLGKFREMVRDREVWCGAVHGVAKSQIRLSSWTTAMTIIIQAHVEEKYRLK